MEVSLPLVQPAWVEQTVQRGGGARELREKDDVEADEKECRGVILAFAEEAFIMCSGCSQQVPSNETLVHASLAGCCCLSCPTWYACSNCSARELQRHREAHPDHVAYCVDAEDELRTRDSALQFRPLNPWTFTFNCFIWPLFKMFVPLAIATIQVSSTCCFFLHATQVMHIQAFLSTAPAVCLDPSDHQSRFPLSSSLLSLINLLYVCTTFAHLFNYLLCCDILHFERLLMCSIFVDMRTPAFKSSRSYKAFIRGFGYMFLCQITLVSYITFESSRMQRTALAQRTSNCTFGSGPSVAAQASNDAGQVLGSVAALAGGIYFLYCSFCDEAEFGLASRFSYQDHTLENMSKISHMKSIPVQALKRVCRAFVSGAHLATCNRRKSYSAKQIAFLKKRLSSAAHVYACALVIDDEQLLHLERSVYDPHCWGKITNWKLCWQRWFPLGR
jgi:hypothetical protein